MKYFLLIFLTINPIMLFASDIKLEKLETLLSSPRMITTEKGKVNEIQRKSNFSTKHLSLHISKLNYLQDLLNQNKLNTNIESLLKLSINYQWTRTQLKLKSIQGTCMFQKMLPEKCIEALESLRQFIESQELNIEKQNYFLTQLEKTEETAFEYSDLFQDFKTYFNEEVEVINSLKLIPSTPIPSTVKKQNQIEYKLILTLIFLAGGFVTYLRKKNILLLIKSKSWFNKIKPQNELDQNILLKNIKILFPIISITEKEFKNTRIKLLSNNFFLTVKIQLPSKESFYYDLDSSDYQSLKNAIFNLQNNISKKDRIQLFDEYDSTGNITSQFIKISFAKN